MRKIKNTKDKKEDIEIIKLNDDERELLYQTYIYVLTQDMIIDLFNFKDTKKEELVKKAINLIYSKDKIYFESFPPLNDYNTSEIFKYFSKISDKFTTKQKITDLLEQGAMKIKFDMFLIKVKLIYHEEYKRYVINDFEEMKDFTINFIKLKLAGELFIKMLEVNNRLGKLEKTFKTKFNKWCSEIDKDLKQVSTKIKLTNKQIADLKTGFKNMNLSQAI